MRDKNINKKSEVPTLSPLQRLSGPDNLEELIRKMSKTALLACFVAIKAYEEGRITQDEKQTILTGVYDSVEGE